jgi:hypothetical protein
MNGKFLDKLIHGVPFRTDMFSRTTSYGFWNALILVAALPFVVKALTVVYRVHRHPSISYGFPAEAPTDVRQAREAEPVDAPLAPAAVAARTDVAPAQVEAAAYKYCAQSAVAEPA